MLRRDYAFALLVQVFDRTDDKIGVVGLIRHILHRLHFFPGLTLVMIGLAILYQIFRWLPDRQQRKPSFLLGILGAGGLLWAGYFLEFQRVIRYFPSSWATWVECGALVEIVCLVGMFLGLLAWRGIPLFRPERRRFLQVAGAGLCVAPLGAAGFGVVERNRFQLSEVDVPIPNLPKDLDGLRIVQITDIHLSPFLSESQFARAVDMANETRANLALVTGDLISRRGDPLDACLRQLARLRAEAGVLGCLGNHEIYTGTERYVAEQGSKIGIDFLRHQAKTLRFGKTDINFAGVDYQQFQTAYLVGVEKLIVPGAFNVLLSHNPDVFPVATAQGYTLTIAGHTHGGQVNFELLHQNVNVARYFTPYTRGLYRNGTSSVYVSSGLGTIGVPIRLGAPPEVSLLRLCAI